MEVVLMMGVGVVSVVAASVEVVSEAVVIVVSCGVVGHSWSVPVVPVGVNTDERAHALGMTSQKHTSVLIVSTVVASVQVVSVVVVPVIYPKWSSRS